MGIRRNRPVGDVIRSLSDDANKLTKGASFHIQGDSSKRDLNVREATITDIANMLSTLINDLKAKGIIR